MQELRLLRLGGFITQSDPIGIAGGLNLYGYANGDPINFSDPFGLCAEDPDEITIEVTVDCGDGTTGKREVKATRVSGSRLAALRAAVDRLQGGTDDITPQSVREWYNLLIETDHVYIHPSYSDDGLPVLTAGQTRLDGRFPLAKRVSLARYAWRNLGNDFGAQIVGHEGAHMVSHSDGLGLTEDQVGAIMWRYGR